MEDKYAFFDPMDKEWKDVTDRMRKTERDWGAPFIFSRKSVCT